MTDAEKIAKLTDLLAEKTDQISDLEALLVERGAVRLSLEQRHLENTGDDSTILSKMDIYFYRKYGVGYFRNKMQAIHKDIEEKVSGV